MDLLGVGPLVARTIRKLRAAGVDGPFLLCGEPAASAAAHTRFGAERDLYFSVGELDWARATLSYARIKARQRGSVSFDHSSAYHQTNIALVKVIDAKAFGRDHLAKQVALRWFEATCPLQPFPDNQNWKVLKKLLAASLFGAPEGRFFLPLGIWKRSQATSARSTIQDELPDSRLSRMTFPAMLAARSLRRAAQTTTYCRFCAR